MASCGVLETHFQLYFIGKVKKKNLVGKKNPASLVVLEKSYSALQSLSWGARISENSNFPELYSKSVLNSTCSESVS